MFPKVFCLCNTRCPPTVFDPKSDHPDFDKNSESSHICILDNFEDNSVNQILIFTEGTWPDNCAENKVDICFDGQNTKLCTLTKSSRCFLWCKDECKESHKLLNEDGKIVLHANIQGSFNNKENLQFSSPLSSSLSEGEIMKKCNETTPELTVLSPKPQGRKRGRPGKENSAKVAVKPEENIKTTDKERGTPSNSKTPLVISKKRQLDKENSSSTTPKLKAARGRGSRVFGHETTPLAKRALVTKKTAQVSASDSPSSSVVRCVQLSSRVPTPSSRWGHSMCMVNDKKAILIGGQGNKMQLSKDSVWALDTDFRSWKSVPLKTEGMKPECRTGHSATYDPVMRCIYIFGGSKNSKWFHDVHMYDLDEQKWSLVKANGKAPTRAYHTATLYRHELWMFGGVFPMPDPQPDGCDNELHIFSPVMEGWYKPIVTGEKPLPRSGHSANIVDDRLVIFGGWDFPFCYNDIHILDLTTVDWSSPTVQGEPPKPRCWSASTAITNSRLFYHGGYDGDNPLDDAFIFDLDSYCWQKLSLDMGPSARAGHACIRLCSNYDDKEEDEIIIFGGGDNDGNFFNDMLSFYVPCTSAVAE